MSEGTNCKTIKTAPLSKSFVASPGTAKDLIVGNSKIRL